MKVYKYRSIEEEIFKRDLETISNNSFTPQTIAC